MSAVTLKITSHVRVFSISSPSTASGGTHIPKVESLSHPADCSLARGWVQLSRNRAVWKVQESSLKAGGIRGSGPCCSVQLPLNSLPPLLLGSQLLPRPDSGVPFWLNPDFCSSVSGFPCSGGEGTSFSILSSKNPVQTLPPWRTELGYHAWGLGFPQRPPSPSHLSGRREVTFWLPHSFPPTSTLILEAADFRTELRYNSLWLLMFYLENRGPFTVPSSSPEIQIQCREAWWLAHVINTNLCKIFILDLVPQQVLWISIP